MQTFRRAGTVIFVSTRSPEATVAQDIEATGVVMQWAPSIAAADGLLNSAPEMTVIVSELALADGNWRDLVQRVRSREVPVPIVLLTSASTAELWWDALECGVNDILPKPLTACPLCLFLKTYFTSGNGIRESSLPAASEKT
jgi:DNA-binding response OmpR family regulator